MDIVSRKRKTIPQLKAETEKGLSKHTLIWRREQHCGFSGPRWVGTCKLCHRYVRLARGQFWFGDAFNGDLIKDFKHFKKRCWGAELEAKYKRRDSARRTYLRKVYSRGGIDAVIDAVVPKGK
jgi:hypothetical protein